MANKALDNREGDAVPPEPTPVPQGVDGPEVGGDAVSRLNKRPARRRANRPVEARKLDSRGPDEQPAQDAWRETPQSVDGPEVNQEAIEPRDLRNRKG